MNGPQRTAVSRKELWHKGQLAGDPHPRVLWSTAERRKAGAPATYDLSRCWGGSRKQQHVTATYDGSGYEMDFKTPPKISGGHARKKIRQVAILEHTSKPYTGWQLTACITLNMNCQTHQTWTESQTMLRSSSRRLLTAFARQLTPYMMTLFSSFNNWLTGS